MVSAEKKKKKKANILALLNIAKMSPKKDPSQLLGELKSAHALVISGNNYTS